MGKIKTIKEIYNCEYFSKDNEQYSIPAWHNKVIDKKITELSVFDVARMLRQKVFIEVGVNRAIAFLYEDPFAGDIFIGELLKLILSCEYKYLIPYIDDLKKIAKEARERSKQFFQNFNDDETFQEDEKVFLSCISFIENNL